MTTIARNIKTHVTWNGAQAIPFLYDVERPYVTTTDGIQFKRKVTIALRAVDNAGKDHGPVSASKVLPADKANDLAYLKKEFGPVFAERLPDEGTPEFKQLESVLAAHDGANIINVENDTWQNSYLNLRGETVAHYKVVDVNRYHPARDPRYLDGTLSEERVNKMRDLYRIEIQMPDGEKRIGYHSLTPLGNGLHVPFEEIFGIGTNVDNPIKFFLAVRALFPAAVNEPRFEGTVAGLRRANAPPEPELLRPKRPRYR